MIRCLTLMPAVTGLVMFSSHDLDDTNDIRGGDAKIGNNEGNGSKDFDGDAGDNDTNAQSVSLQLLQQSRSGARREYNAIPSPRPCSPPLFPFKILKP